MSSKLAHSTRDMAESIRLNVLKSLDILDTPPESYYDRITRSVALKFDAPIALVCLVDKERLFFKSAYGINTTEINRKYTFCSVAITKTEVLVVKDALQDYWFEHCPIVENPPNARFYAGAPIILSSGICIGTVCFILPYPYNHFSEDDKLFMQDMANVVAYYLDLRLSMV